MNKLHVPDDACYLLFEGFLKAMKYFKTIFDHLKKKLTWTNSGTTIEISFSDIQILDDNEENDETESTLIKINLEAYKPFYREWDLSVFKAKLCIPSTLNADFGWKNILN